MQFLALYSRALGWLKPEQKLGILLALASVLIAAAGLAEVVLFGLFVEALARLQPVSTFLLAWALLGFLKIACIFWLSEQAERLAHRRRFAAMARFMERVIAVAPGYWHAHDSKKKTERLMQVMLRGADQMFFLWLSFFRDHLSAAAVVAFSLPLALSMGWPLTLLIFALLGVYAAAAIMITRRAYEGHLRFEKFHGHVAERASDILNNAALVQSYARLTTEITGLNQAMQHVLSAQFPVLAWWSRKSALTRGAGTLFLVCTLAGASYFYGEGRIDLGDVIIFAGLALLLLARAAQLADFASTLLFRQDALRDFFSILDAEAAIKEQSGANALNLRGGQIEFKDVSLAGAGDTFSFTVKPGQSVALADADGTTASFLAAALMRAADLQQGEILIDGQNIDDVSLISLRQAISYVSSGSDLLHRSVMENLSLAKPGASQDEILAAVTQAGAHDFIAAKRDGFHTLISEKERNFSPEERQRLVIARAILKNAPIVIFEDRQNGSSDKKLGEALDHLFKTRTVLILSRDPAVLQKAGRILVFENGRLAESGTFSELNERQDFAFRLSRQMSDNQQAAPARRAPAVKKSASNDDKPQAQNATK